MSDFRRFFDLEWAATLPQSVVVETGGGGVVVPPAQTGDYGTRIGGLLKRSWTDHRLDPDFDASKVTHPDLQFLMQRANAMHQTEIARPVTGGAPVYGESQAGQAWKSLDLTYVSRAGNNWIYGLVDAYRATHAKLYLDQMWEILEMMRVNVIKDGYRRRYYVPAQNGYPATTYIRMPYLTPYEYDWKEMSYSMGGPAMICHYLRVNQQHDSRYKPTIDFWDDYMYTNTEQLRNHLWGTKENYRGSNVPVRSLWWPVDNIAHPLIVGVAMTLWYRYLDSRDFPGDRISHHSTEELRLLALAALTDLYRSTFKNASRAKIINSVLYPEFPAVVWPHKPESVLAGIAPGQLGDYPYDTSTGLYACIKEAMAPDTHHGAFGKMIHAANIFVMLEPGVHWENRPNGGSYDRASGETTSTTYLKASHTVWKDMWGSFYGDGNADDAGGKAINSLSLREKGITAPQWDGRLLWNNQGGYAGKEVTDWGINGSGSTARLANHWRGSDPVVLPFTGSPMPFAPDVSPDEMTQGYWYKKVMSFLRSSNTRGFMTQVGPAMLAASMEVLGWDVDTAVKNPNA